MTSFFIETYGCSHNFADSEQMGGVLKQAQFEPAESIEKADIVIFNTCTVKSPTADAFFNRLEEIKNAYPYKSIIIAGCIPQTDPERLKKFSLLGTRQIHRIVEIVEETLNNNIVKMLETGEMPPLDLPRIRKNPFIEVIPINRGCLSRCSFCKTKAARGDLQSYPISEIVKAAQKAVLDGVKEIWLTSQDTGCYGFDIKTNLPSLLCELVKISGDFKIRVGMMNPQHILRIRSELIAMYKHEKVFKFLHLPLQAGSNAVLLKMARGYTVEQFMEVYGEFKREIPELNIMTDIIVGFPTETEEDYWQTLNIVRQMNPDSINISRFWARPKTPAAKLEPLSPDVVKHRSKVLMDVFQNISKMQNERWMGWEGVIIIDEKGEMPSQWIGRNYAYKQVIVEGDYKLGDLLKVKVNVANVWDLRGISI